jgi:hypothetical protein
MAPRKSGQDLELVLHDKTGALLMLNKEERILLKELLLMVRNSGNVRTFITKKLGEKYIQIGEELLKSMGGS